MSGFISLSLWLTRPRTDDKTTKQTAKESKYEMKIKKTKQKQSSINQISPNVSRMIGGGLPTIDRESHLSCWQKEKKKYELT